MNKYNPDQFQLRPPHIGMTKDQIDEGLLHITATNAVDIISGNWGELWDKKKGLIEREPPSLPMLMGLALEDLHRYWYQLNTDYAVGYDPQDPLLIHPDNSLFACHIDGMKVGSDEQGNDHVLYPWEGKAVNGFSKFENVLERYYPQLQHIMYVTGHVDIEFSVLIGNSKHEFITVARNDKFIEQYVEMAKTFWQHVIDNVRPEDQESADIIPHEDKKVRRLTLDNDPDFVFAGKEWVKNQKAARAFNNAAKHLKELCPADALTAFTDDVYLSVGKNGAKTIRAMTDKKKDELLDQI